MLLFPLTVLAALLPPVAAQSSDSAVVTTYTVRPYLPSGYFNSSGSLESTQPTECLAGCYGVEAIYYYCFINSTLLNGKQYNISSCNGYLCQQATYDQLSQCLNCIVANGDERPFGYYTNTSLTAAPTGAGFGGRIPTNPNGLINSTQANGWLQNVTNQCAAANSSVTGATTVTATPTTTGPYYTTWTSGADVEISVWTGLTSFTSALSVAYATRTVTQTSTVSTSSGGTTQTQSGSGGLSSAAAASASSSSSSTAKSAAFRGAIVPVWARLLSSLL